MRNLFSRSATVAAILLFSLGFVFSGCNSQGQSTNQKMSTENRPAIGINFGAEGKNDFC